MGCVCSLNENIPDGDSYDGVFREGKKHTTLDAKYVWKDGSTYVGPFENDMMCGKGQFTASNGASFLGEFKNNQFEGYGKLIDPNGDIYEGEFKRGLRDGQGTQFIKSTGEKYTGEWSNNLRHGKGRLLFSQDAHGRLSYDGEWFMNKKHGNGILVFIKDSSYSGEFVDDAYTGEGLLLLHDGSSFKGKFDNNFLINGIYEKDNRIYNGQLAHHVPHGIGKMILSGPNGYTYDGSWMKGKPCGQGTMVMDEGSIFVGTFGEDGISSGIAKYSDKSVFQGEFKLYKKHGKGRWTFSNGEALEGFFLEDKPNGPCTLTYVNLPDGQPLETPDIFLGVWLNGMLIGSSNNNLKLASLKLLRSSFILKQKLAIAELENFKKENLLKENNLCTVCNEEEVNTVFLECAHCICCDKCANEIFNSSGKCPAPKCNAKIGRVVKTFHS